MTNEINLKRSCVEQTTCSTRRRANRNAKNVRKLAKQNTVHIFAADPHNDTAVDML